MKRQNRAATARERSMLNRAALARRHALRVPAHDLLLEIALIRQQRRARRAQTERCILNRWLVFPNRLIEVLVMLQMRILARRVKRLRRFGLDRLDRRLRMFCLPLVSQLFLHSIRETANRIVKLIRTGHALDIELRETRGG